MAWSSCSARTVVASVPIAKANPKDAAVRIAFKPLCVVDVESVGACPAKSMRRHRDIDIDPSIVVAVNCIGVNVLLDPLAVSILFLVT
jgi:hypothetical protein